MNVTLRDIGGIKMNQMEWKEPGKVIPLYPAESYEYYESSEDTVIMKIVGTDAETYNAYLKTLEEAGFTRYTGNVIEKNLFGTYISDVLTVNAYYIDNNKTVRVVWEPRGALPILAEENVYEEKVDTLLTGVQLEKIMFSEGMSYFIRLCDNSFIIIDGGVSDPGGIECQKLYDLLREQAPEGKMVIAAWIMTHCHGDHIGLFSDFLIKYHDELQVEQLIYHFPRTDEMAVREPYMLDDSHFRYYSFMKAKETYLADVPAIKPHTGNRFYIRNAVFEVLGTQEDLYPRNVSKYGINASTTILRMDIGGQITMWLGDAATVTNDLLEEQFGDYVKSDLLQLAHHGGRGAGTVSLYKRIDPEIGLIAFPKSGYDHISSVESTKWLLDESPNAKLIIWTGYGTSSMKLPFRGDTAKYQKRPHSADDPLVNPKIFE